MRISFKWILASLFLFAGTVKAATYNLPAVLNPSWGCSLNGTSVICDSFNLNNNDVVTVTGNIELKVNGNANLSNASINIAGANNLNISVNGNIDSSTGVKINANVTATGNVKLGYQGALLGNVTAGSVVFGGESSIDGSVIAMNTVNTTGNNVAISGGIEADSITLGKGSSIGGPINTVNLTTNSDVALSDDINADTVVLGARTAVTGAIAASSSITTGSGTNITGDISSPLVTIGDKNTINGNLDVGDITVESTKSVINGNIVATNNVVLGDKSSVIGVVVGNNITLSSAGTKIDGDAIAVDTITIGWDGNISGDATASHINNASGNSDNTVQGDIFCSTNSGFANRECTTPTPPPANDYGLASCTGFSDMLTQSGGIIGGSSSSPNFSYKSGSTVNGKDISGVNGNSPTPSGVVDDVATNFPAIIPLTYPANSNFGSGTTSNQGGMLAGSYGTIKVGENKSSSTAGGGLYHIKKLVMDEKSSITLGSGDYFIKEVKLEEKSEIIIAPGAHVRLFLQGEFETDEKVEINKHGNVDQLTIFIYGTDDDGEFELGEKSYFKGLIYSPNPETEIEIDEKSTIEGAIINAGEVEFDEKVTVISDGGRLDAISNAVGCSSQPTEEFLSCPEFSALSEFGIVGNTSFNYGFSSIINNQPIIGSSGNSPTPTGVVSNVTVPEPFPAFAPPAFPYSQLGTSILTNATNVAPGSYGLLQTSWWPNRSISTSGGGTYYINTLKIRGINSGITLGAGDYFIDTIDMDMDSYINIAPGAKVRIFIGNKLDSTNRISINENGNVEDLAVFLYDNTSFAMGYRAFGIGSSVFKGLLYSPFENTTINIGKPNWNALGWPNYVEGAILSAGDVTFGVRTNVTYSEQTKQSVLDAVGCSALPPEPEVHHYRIVLPQQELVSCYAAPVTVKACANADCSSVYANTVEGMLNSTEDNSVWNGASSKAAPFTFATGESTYGLSFVPGGSTTVSLNNLVPVASNATQCVDTSGNDISSCDILFKAAGLLVSAPSPTAGNDTTITVRAFETDPNTGVCIARVTGTHDIRLGMECSNPNSCSSGQSFTANGLALNMFNDTDSGNDDEFVDTFANSSISLTFDSTGTATFSANYTDVGQIRIHAALDLDEEPNAGEPGIDDPEVTLSGTGSYVVRPHTLIVQGLDDDGNPVAATTDVGPGYIAAGEPFNVAIQSLNVNGDVTPNFGNESTPAQGTVAYHSDAFPTNGYGEPSYLDVEDLNTTPDQDSPGRLIGEGAIWNEAGTVNLTAALKGGKYLGVNDTADKPPSPIGRFYPHHFKVVSSTVTNSCDAGSFSYLGQDNIGIYFTLHALNAGGDLVQNYGHENYTGVAAIGAAAVDTTNGLPIDRLIADVSATWVDGVYDVALADAEVTRRVDNAPDGPFDDTHIQLIISDAEGDKKFASGDATEDLPGTLNLRYGRMVLENISGPEDEDLDIVMRTEYWNGSYFVQNNDDSCTAVFANQLNITTATNIVTTPDQVPSPSLVAGELTPGYLYWQAPTAGDIPGEFDFEYQAPEWLQFDWGSGSNENPTATAGFGVYRGNDRIIFSLERNF